jgi:hypothetical protein
MRRVSDLVEQQPDQDPYEVLKAHVLSALQLTDYQRADKLFESPADLAASTQQSPHHQRSMDASLLSIKM